MVTEQYFLKVFDKKTRLFQGLLPDMELLKKTFPTILVIKNAGKVQKKIKKKKIENSSNHRMTYFNTLVAIKCHRDNKKRYFSTFLRFYGFYLHIGKKRSISISELK